MGEVCPSCFNGKMLAWEGSLRCRKCDHRADLESGAPVARAAVKAAPRASRVSASREIADVRPMSTTGALLTGIGMFVAFYGTILIGTVLQIALA